MRFWCGFFSYRAEGDPALNRFVLKFFLILLILYGGLQMLEVTDLAVSNLKDYMAQNNVDSALRVALMQGG